MKEGDHRHGITGLEGTQLGGKNFDQQQKDHFLCIVRLLSNVKKYRVEFPPVLNNEPNNVINFSMSKV